MADEFDFDDLLELHHVLERAPERVVAKGRLAVAKTKFDTIARAQVLAPVDTSNLKNSIGADDDPDGLGWEAGPTAEYGAAIEYGTRPHEIRAKHAKALHWVDPETGEDVFRRKVMHPGTRPQPYMRPAFAAATKNWDQVVAVLAAEALE